MRSWLCIVCLSLGLFFAGVSHAAGPDGSKAGAKVKNPDKQAVQKAKANNRGWAMRKSWYERLKWPAACEKEYQEQYTPDGPPGGAGKYGYGVDIYKLKGNWRLAVVTCSFALYQGSFVALSFEQGRYKPGQLLTLTDYERDQSGKVTPATDRERTGLPTFHPASRTLTVLDEGRGLGDCGSLVTFAFKGGQAVVTDARAQYCFDDPKKIIADPKKWPKVEVTSTNRGKSALTLEEAENRLVWGGYIETLMNANWAVEQGAAIVPLLGRMLGQSEAYEKELAGATGAFPFNAIWALGHIPKQSALKVLKKYEAESHNPGAALAIEGWKLRAKKKAAGYGVLINDGPLLKKPSAGARVLKQLKAGQPVRIEKTMITSPGEKGPRGGPVHYDRVRLLPGGEQGYIGREGDDFSPFM